MKILYFIHGRNVYHVVAHIFVTMLTKLLRASTTKIFHFSISDFIKVKTNYLREYDKKFARHRCYRLSTNQLPFPNYFWSSPFAGNG